MLLRILLGFPFVYLLSGFPLARLFLPEEKTISLKLVLTSFVCSLFLTYPAAVLTTIFEGQSTAAIYSVHLPRSLFSLALISLLTFLVLLHSNKNWWKLSLPKLTKAHVILTLIIALYSFFVFWNLGRADVVGDDFDLGYQAYNLHDGIQAARRAYILSFATHPPLFMTIKHFGMQLFSPFGLETLSGWMFRGVEGMMGIGTILATFLLAEKYVSRKTALIAALLLAVNNYLIFFGRYYEREIYYLPFIILAFYYSLENKKTVLTGFLLGCALLIKASAVIAIPPVVLMLWLNDTSFKKIFKFLFMVLVIYSPIIVFNILMFVNTGYLDGTFSRLFRVYHPLNTGVPPNSYLVNPVTSFFLLADLYGWPVFFFFLAAIPFIKLNNVNKLLMAMLVVSVVFFMFSPMRAYYLIIFTIPLVVFAAELISRSKLLILPLGIVLVFSTVYSFNSNLISQALANQYNDYGSEGNPGILAKNLFHSDYSYAAAAFSPERGWKSIKARLDKNYQSGDCLVFGQSDLDLPVRYYLRTHDLVKLAFLGRSYKPGYQMCDDNSSGRKVILYYDLSGNVNLK